MTTICLHFPLKKGYTCHVPVCPQCSATIHTGANDLCPACGYCLPIADQSFGTGQVEFSRVVDSAGALTHQERQSLLEYLEGLERDIPPVALCIYITDDGHAEEFRTHAHWILNHAHIHHPSFGRREKQRTLEEGEFRLRIDREAAAAEEEELPSAIPVRLGWLTRLRHYLRDALHPHLPPPVQQQWMLILVLDVQLERACFSWGYQLDPYINPDHINSCILGAKFQFRERAMLTGLKLVMQKATRQIAMSARRVNAQLRRTGRLKALLLALGGAGLFWAAAPCPAAAVGEAGPAEGGAVAPAVPDDDVAEEVVAAAPAEPGAPATFSELPRWSDEDHRHLMEGELPDAYTLLFPPADAVRAQRRFASQSSRQESDSRLPARYAEAYRHVSPAGLCDPQGLLSVEERRDVEHVLRELNANGRFSIYVALYRAGQQLPPELTAHSLTKSVARPLDYVAMVLFPLGDSQSLDLGYQLVNPADDERHAWLRRVRSAAAPEGDGVEALLLAVRELCAVLTPLSAQFKPNVPENFERLPQIEIELRPEEGEKKVPFKDKLAAFFKDEAHHPLIAAVVSLLLLLALAVFVFFFRRRTGTLLESRPDVRLSSPYGAGVSRYVRYLEGKESPKETSIF